MAKVRWASSDFNGRNVPLRWKTEREWKDPTRNGKECVMGWSFYVGTTCSNNMAGSSAEIWILRSPLGA